MYKMNTITPTANHIFHGFGINFQQSLANLRHRIEARLEERRGCPERRNRSYSD